MVSAAHIRGITTNSVFFSIGCNRQTQALSWSNKNLIAYPGGNYVVIYDPAEGRVVRTLRLHLSTVTCVEWVPGDRLLSGAADGRVYLTDIQSSSTQERSKLVNQHDASVIAAAHSRGFIASSATDGSLKVAMPEAQVRTIDNGSRFAISLSMFEARGGLLIAAGMSDRSIEIFAVSAENLTHCCRLEGHQGWVKSLDWTVVSDASYRDQLGVGVQLGDVLLASASQDKYIRIWLFRPIDGKETLSDDNDAGGLLSTRVWSFHLSGTRYRVVADSVLEGHEDWVMGVRWNRDLEDGTLRNPPRLLSSSADSSVILWELDVQFGTWGPKCQVGDVGGGRLLSFYSVAFQPDGKRFASNSHSGAVHFWNDDGSPVPRNVGGHLEAVQDVQWAPSGEYFVSTSLDETTRAFARWRSSRWVEIGRPQIHGYPLQALGFIDPRTLVSVADEKVIRVFRASGVFDKLLSASQSEAASHSSITLPRATLPPLGLSNKKELGSDSSGADLTLNTNQPPFEEDLMQATLWPEVEKLYGHGDDLVAISMSADRKWIASSAKASSSADAGVRLFDAHTFRESPTALLSHSLTVTKVAFCPTNSRLLLTVSRDRAISVFEDSERIIFLPKAHARIIWDCSWSASGERFATASRDKTVKIWRFQAPAQPRQIIQKENAVTSVSFHPHLEELLVCGLECGSIHFHNADTGDHLYSVAQPFSHLDAVRALRWKAAGGDTEGTDMLVSCSLDHSIRLFTCSVNL